MAKFHCVLPWGPSVNHMYRSGKGGRQYKTQKAKTYEVECKKRIHDFGQGSVDSEARFSLSLIAYPPDKRKRDIDNLLKPVLDALQQAGVIEDDSQIDFLSISRAAPMKGGCMVVELEERE